MKKIFPWLIFLSVASQLPAQSVISNGNLEQFTSGVPNNWTYTRGNGDASIEQTSIKSPFTDFYSASTRSVLLHDSSSSSFGPSLNTSFTDSAGLVTLSFDFRLASGATSSSDYWFMETKGPVTTFNIIEIGNNGNFLITDAGTSLSLSLTRDTWYQYSSVIDTTTGIYSGSLTPFGGSSVTWTNRIGYNQTSISSILVKDWSPSFQNPSLYLDNFYVSAVPEPGTTTLLFLGMFIFFVRYGKKHESHRSN